MSRRDEHAARIGREIGGVLAAGWDLLTNPAAFDHAPERDDEVLLEIPDEAPEQGAPLEGVIVEAAPICARCNGARLVGPAGRRVACPTCARAIR